MQMMRSYLKFLKGKFYGCTKMFKCLDKFYFLLQNYENEKTFIAAQGKHAIIYICSCYGNSNILFNLFAIFRAS